MSVYNFAETIVAGSSAQGGGVVEQSLKFNDDHISHLTRVFATDGNRKTWTWSGWIKRGNIGTAQRLWGTVNGSSQEENIRFEANNTIRWYAHNAGGSAADNDLSTVAVFRDVSDWYHIQIVKDTTQSTAANRNKLYVNGVLQSWAGTSYASLNYDGWINASGSDNNHRIGAHAYSTGSQPFDGYMSDVHFIDGQALSPTSFGETIDNSWKKIDYTGTYGTNGFKLNFQDDVVSEGFNTVTWKGNSPLSQSISGLGFSPDLVWIKSRSQTYNHVLVDTVRGQGKDLYSNTTGAQTSTSSELISFDADGFSVGSGGSANDPTGSLGFVAWCWEAGGTPTAVNSAGAGAVPTAGSVKIDGVNSTSALAGSTAATKISANTTRGFSIVTFTADAVSGTVAHGLTTAPDLIIAKPINHAGTNWYVQVPDVLPANEILNLDGNTAAFNPGENHFNDTVPTDSVFSYGGYMGNSLTGDDKLAYCFHSVNGYSKIGTWQNNNSTTGTQVTGLGFKPAWIMVKDIDAGETWYILDNTRQPTNVSPPSTKFLIPNATSTEGSNNASTATIDFQADGFQIKTTNPASGELSYGTRNYIYMAFADTREAAFFKDVSGQGNHFAPERLDYRDSMIDSPSNSFATLNPLDNYNTGATLSEGNLKWTIGGADGASRSTYVMTAGKWYVEFLSNNDYIGVVSGNASIVNMNGTQTVFYAQDGTKRVNGSGSSYGASYADGDIIGIALNMDDEEVTFYKNGASQGIISLTSVGSEGYSVSCGSGSGSTNATANFGQDSTFSGATPAGGNTDANSIGTFKYAPPAGYLALCTQNLPTPTILDPSDNFNTVLYTGTSAENAITAIGFKPDFSWLKDRDNSTNHVAFDSVRGATKTLRPDDVAAETTDAQKLKSFDSDGFTLGTDNNPNGSTRGPFVAWNWKAGGTPTATNSAGVGNAPTSGSVMIDGVASTTALNGQIAADKISANTKAGFSIISYTGTGAATQTVNHGLTKTPEMLIVKDRVSNSNNNQWQIWHKDAGDGDDYGYFTNAAFTGSAAIIGTDATRFTVGRGVTATTNETNDTYITYAFHSVDGYSKVGSYIGNGVADGPYVYTGFRPAWLLVKRASGGVGHWDIFDNKRETFNEMGNQLYASQALAEASNDHDIDFLSNGFKWRDASGSVNASGTYIYLAFAESPFKNSKAR
jgi:hypothetical protein